jgi:hypothetical protein
VWLDTCLSSQVPNWNFMGICMSLSPH